MDSETGEFSESYQAETRENQYTDVNTEVVPRDEETGENRDWPWPNKPFKIPRSCYTPSSKRKQSKKRYKIRKANEQELELITAIIFLLPTMIFFHPFLAILTVMIEIILHRWSHKRNRKLGDDTIFFHQSPLHGIAKEYCGICKEIRAGNRIIEIQDRKNDRFRAYQLQSLRRVVT